MQTFKESSSVNAVIAPASTSRLYWAVALLLGGTLAATSLTQQRPSEPLAAEIDTIPLEFARFRVSHEPPLRDDVVASLMPTSYLSRVYSADGSKIRLFIAYYGQQRPGVSMHSPKNCLPGSGWEMWSHRMVPLTFRGGSAEINQYSVRSGNDRQAVLYWYQSGSRIVANEYVGKLYLIRDALTMRRTAAAIVIVTVDDTPEAIAAGTEFASHIVEPLSRCFRN
jgi:EpsI family protein